jgi:hypothetical protein
MTILTDQVATDVAVLHATGEGTTGHGNLIDRLVAIDLRAGFTVTEGWN